MGDYCDTPAFKSHPLFSIDPSAVQIMIYYDDVEVTNPLGSKIKTHTKGSFIICGIMVHLLSTAAFHYSPGNI